MAQVLLGTQDGGGSIGLNLPEGRPPPRLHMGKAKLREGTPLAWGHTANCRQNMTPGPWAGLQRDSLHLQPPASFRRGHWASCPGSSSRTIHASPASHTGRETIHSFCTCMGPAIPESLTESFHLPACQQPASFHQASSPHPGRQTCRVQECQ